MDITIAAETATLQILKKFINKKDIDIAVGLKTRLLK